MTILETTMDDVLSTYTKEKTSDGFLLLWIKRGENMFFFNFDPKDQQSDLFQTLSSLIENWENEVVEFKAADNNYDRDKIGQYFSAISNEANIKGLQYGWLVFGVRNKDKAIIGTNYRNTAGLETLKHEISTGTTGGISYIEIYEIYPVVNGEKKRVIMFQIPAAATAIPTGWTTTSTEETVNHLVPCRWKSWIAFVGRKRKTGQSRLFRMRPSNALTLPLLQLQDKSIRRK